METFTKVLIGVCVILLGMYYYRQWKQYKEEQASLTWPRVIAPCPDYWIHEGNNKCKNQFNLGTCPKDPKTSMAMIQGSVDFNGNMYKGKDGDIAKCKWAKTCNTTWEGIDNLCA